MHAIEKIMARNAGRSAVRTGEIVDVAVDFAQINDLYPQTIYSFREMGGKRVWDPDKAAFVFDHYAPAPTIRTAQTHEEMRRFARENGLSRHFDINAGVCHQVLAEAGVVRPGTVVVATDSHTTTHGAFGALGTGCGATDMACVLLTGTMWMRVPEIVQVCLRGQPGPGVFPKDVILHVLGRLGANGAVYQAVDFTGDYVQQLDVSGRMTICNMAVEMGAKTAYMQPNRAVLDYVSARSDAPFTVEQTDEDFVYAATYSVDVSKIEPQVALPGNVDDVTTARTLEQERIPVQQGFLGSCTNGRLEDLRTAARILHGRHIAPDTRLVVVPASAEVMCRAAQTGCLATLIQAGATIVSSGCAACLGTHEGLLAPGERCVSSTNRNFIGRMGSTKAEIYLASPATVAASVLNGYIADPARYL